MIEIDALYLSLRLAFLTSLIVLVIGLPISYMFARSRSSWIKLLESILLLPIVLPPSVLGFYLLISLSSIGWAFSFAGLLVGSIIYSFSFAFQSFVAGFKTIEAEYFEVSASLGDSATKSFFRVALPMAKNSIIAGTLLSFAHTLGEFGVVLMIGGNIRGQTRTLSIAIYDQVQALDFESAKRTSIFLLAFSFFILVLINYFKDKNEVARK